MRAPPHPEVRIGSLQVGDIIIWEDEKWALTAVIKKNGMRTQVFQRCIKGNTELDPELRTDFGAYAELRVPLYGRCVITHSIRLVNRLPV